MLIVVTTTERQAAPGPVSDVGRETRRFDGTQKQSIATAKSFARLLTEAIALYL